MQDNFIRITQQGFTKRPIRIMVVGYRYKVDFGPSVKPQVHLLDQQKHCSCELDTACPAIKAVAEYLCNGGLRAPAPLPLCPICGAETFHDRVWIINIPMNSVGVAQQVGSPTFFKPKPKK